MVYQITYELRNPDRDYSDLYLYLEKELGRGGVNVLKNTWWLSFAEEVDLEQLVESIRSHIEQSDIFYVSRITANSYNGWMPTQYWNWVKENL